MAAWIATETFKLEERWTCARCSEKAADRDVRIPVKRPGAGLKVIARKRQTGRHERPANAHAPTAFGIGSVLELASAAIVAKAKWQRSERSEVRRL